MKDKNPKPISPDSDPVQLIIEQEVEEFLRDLTLEFPFPEIFEILRQHEFKERFGKNVSPMPQKKFDRGSLSQIRERIDTFLKHLRGQFGLKYYDQIDKSFKFYTETTVDDES